MNVAQAKPRWRETARKFPCETPAWKGQKFRMRNPRGRAVGERRHLYARLAENRRMRRLLWDLAWAECWAASHRTPASRLMQEGERDLAHRLVVRAAALLESRAQADETAEDVRLKRLAEDA